MVLPTMTTTADLTLGSPREATMAAAMATGAPKPARPSSRPQKEKDTMRAWARMSPLPIVLNTARRSAERPEASVRL